MSDAKTEVDSSSSRSAELATPELPGTSTAMDTGFWDALHAEADADESGPSTPRPDTPPLSAGMTSRSQSVGRGGKDAEETPRRNGKAKKEKEIFAPPLIADLPSAWDEAHESFAVLEKCVYESKRMGASKEQDEMMVCDCVYDRSKLSSWLDSYKARTACQKEVVQTGGRCGPPDLLREEADASRKSGQ